MLSCTAKIISYPTCHSNLYILWHIHYIKHRSIDIFRIWHFRPGFCHMKAKATRSLIIIQSLHASRRIREQDLHSTINSFLFYYIIGTSVLLENRPLIKFRRKRHLGLGGIFSISSPVKILMTSLISCLTLNCT